MTDPTRPEGGGRRKADVTLMLEGTYPYVLGGVSAWIDQIIRGLPELTFSLFYLGSTRTQNEKRVFELPSNVLEVEEVFLQDRLEPAELQPAPLSGARRREIYEALGAFYLAEEDTVRLKDFWRLVEVLRGPGGTLTFGNLLRDLESWEILRGVYDRFCPNESFIDYFWTARFLHLPLWKIWKAIDRVPPAHLFHTISAGYAGFAGALAARFQGVPYLMTEHGIYTKERLAEISQADWIYEADGMQVDYDEGLGRLKQMWMGMFTFLGRVGYGQADQLITLYEGNTLLQIEFGAAPGKLRVIPNGISPSKFDGIYRAQMAKWEQRPERPTVGFIGRIVPIKDVKTLIRAARMVVERMPEVQFLMAGPFVEDPNYYEECVKITKLLNLDQHVHFLGMQKIMEVLPRMDVMVLTSISEGLPLVSLEAMAAGLPQVATDVGACRELIFGRTLEDKAIGRAGRLTKILSPAETAEALLSILRDPATVRRMGAAGRRRAEQFYSMDRMLGSYRDLYRGYVPGVDGVVGGGGLKT